MEVPTRNRADLKLYFAKNSIPTESQFAELIEGMLNQKDDGLVKLPDEPLSIAAAGDAASEKKAIHFFRDSTEPAHDWTISLGRADALGFNISDGNGNSRLFIDRNTGNVGIGLTAPEAKLDIQRGNRAVTHSGAGKTLYVTGNFQAAGKGVEFRHSNGTQGIGFGHNTIYATGSNANQDLNLKARGTGVITAGGSLHISGYIRGNQKGALRIRTASGFVDVGPKNAEWSHFSTDRPRYYFNKEIRVDTGLIGSHNEDLSLSTSGTPRITVRNDNGNTGIGTKSPGQRLVVEGNWNAGKHAGSGMKNGGSLAIVSNAPQIDFIDTNNKDWSIHVNANKMYFIREPWEYTNLVLDGAGNVGIGTDKPGAKLEVQGQVKAGSFSGAIDATNITSGTLAAARIPNLNANKITAGTLAAARIPNLNANKITAGTLAAVRIPNLNANKITAGTLAAARIPATLNSLTVTGTITATNTRPLQQQLVHRRIVFGFAGNPHVDYDTRWKTLNNIYGPFGYAMPRLQAGATRKFRLYAIYSDRMERSGHNEVRFLMKNGQHVTFTLGRTWGGPGWSRDEYSSWFEGTAPGGHGEVQIRATESNGRVFHLELQTWDFF